MMDCGRDFSMTESVRTLAEAFYQASAERDIDRALSLIAEDVDWLVQGPVDFFAFFGQRRGRSAVLEGYAEIARHLRITAYKVEALLVEGDRAAALIRLAAVVRATGKVMTVRTSQFSRFRDGQIAEMRAVVDTYDMIEQTVGHPFDPAGSSEIRSAPALAPV
jgi:ketosteroid isomerase-like protein